MFDPIWERLVLSRFGLDQFSAADQNNIRSSDEEARLRRDSIFDAVTSVFTDTWPMLTLYGVGTVIVHPEPSELGVHGTQATWSGRVIGSRLPT